MADTAANTVDTNTHPPDTTYFPPFIRPGLLLWRACRWEGGVAQALQDAPPDSVPGAAVFRIRSHKRLLEAELVTSQRGIVSFVRGGRSFYDGLPERTRTHWLCAHIHSVRRAAVVVELMPAPPDDTVVKDYLQWRTKIAVRLEDANPLTGQDEEALFSQFCDDPSFALPPSLTHLRGRVIVNTDGSMWHPLDGDSHDRSPHQAS